MAVFGGGVVVCVYCKKGDEEMCVMPKWPGLSQYDGGFSEYVLGTILQTFGKGRSTM